MSPDEEGAAAACRIDEYKAEVVRVERLPGGVLMLPHEAQQLLELFSARGGK